MTGNHTIKVVYVEEPPVLKDVKNSSGLTIDGKTVAPGSELKYEITVTNTFSEQRRFTITDNIPAYTTYVQGSADNSGSFSAGILTWNVDIPAGQSKTVSFKVKVNEDAKGKIVKNEALAAQNDWNKKTNETKNPVPTPPVKSVEDASGNNLHQKYVMPNQQVTYRISFENPADTAKVFTVIDEVDSRQTIVANSPSDGGTVTGRTITWTINMPAKSKKEVTFKAYVNDYGQTVPNEAEVKVDNTYDVKTNTTIIYTPDEPEKTVKSAQGVEINGKSIRVNEDFYYEIKVKNSTDITKTFTVRDNVPAEVTIVEIGDVNNNSYRKNGSGASASGQLVIWNFDLPAASTRTVYIKARIAQANVKVVNKAVQLSDTPEIETKPVTNWTGRIVINAVSDYYAPYGIPSFMYDIKDPDGKTYHRMIIADNVSGNKCSGQAVFDIPTGYGPSAWTVNDQKGTRYVFEHAEDGHGIAPFNVVTNTGTTRLETEKREGIINYYYVIGRWDETTHTHAVTNSFKAS